MVSTVIIKAGRGKKAHEGRHMRLALNKHSVLHVGSVVAHLLVLVAVVEL